MKALSIKPADYWNTVEEENALLHKTHYNVIIIDVSVSPRQWTLGGEVLAQHNVIEAEKCCWNSVCMDGVASR